MKNRVAVTVWTGMTARNILFGPVLNELHEHFTLTIISTFDVVLSKTFEKLYSDILYTQIKITRWNAVWQGHLATVLYHWNYLALWLEKRPKTIEKYISRYNMNHPVKYFFWKIAGQVVNLLRNKSDRDILRDLAYVLNLNRQFSDINAFFLSSTDIVKDQQIAYSCRRLDIPVVVLVHSWDNLPSRGRLAVIPNRLLVWNQAMLEDAVEFQGVPPECIRVVGVPQYEEYRKIGKTTDRGSLLKRLDIDEQQKIITYTGSPSQTFPDEAEFIDALIRSIQDNVFGSAILILRLHPSERQEYYVSQYGGDSSLPIKLDIPDSGFKAANSGTVGSSAAVKNFVELMQYSDVIVNMASTISLDGVLFDTPIVCPHYNPRIAESEWNAAQKWYVSNHFCRVIASNAVSCPRSEKELSECINASLVDHSFKKKERDRLASEMMPELPTAILIRQSIEEVLSRSD